MKMKVSDKTSEISDENLMNSYIGGCQESFRLLSIRWSERLLRFIGKRVYRKELAEELLQETLLSVHRGRSTWVGEEHKFSTWILTIAKNVISSSGRSKRAKMETLWIEDKSELEGTLAEDPITKLFILKAIDSLPSHLAEAFRLTYIEGMDHKEAGEAAKISPENMRARASRARSALREMVG
jgi:RNA polymerase sigma-70 factor (ECF subfamily)